MWIRKSGQADDPLAAERIQLISTILHGMLLAVVIIALALLLVPANSQIGDWGVALALGLGLEIVAGLYLVRRGWYRLVAILLLLSGLILTTGISLSKLGGVYVVPMLLYVLLIPFAGFLLGRATLMFITGFVVGIVSLLYGLQLGGYIVSTSTQPTFASWMLAVVAVVVNSFIHDRSLQLINENMRNVKEARDSLVTTVAERTRELQQANQELQAGKRVAEAFQEKLKTLHAISIQLSRSATEDELLHQAVESGCAHLGFDRVKLYLADGQAGVVVVANGAGRNGQALVKKQQSLTLPAQLFEDPDQTRPRRLVVEEDTVLMEDGEEAGHGWQIAASLWDEDRHIGWLIADNLTSQRLLEPYEPEVLALYALNLANLFRRKRSEDQLVHERAFLRSLLDTIEDLIVYVDKDGKCQGCNRAVEEFLGIERAQLIGYPLDELYLQMAGRDSPTPDEGAYMLERPTRFEQAMRHADGRDLLIDIVTAPYGPAEGTITGLIAVGRDITELRQYQERLQEMVEERTQEFRALFNAIHDLVLVMDRSGRYLQIAPNDSGLLFRPVDELLGKRYQDLFSLSEMRTTVEAIQAALDAGETVNVEYPLDIDGEQRWFDARVSPVDATRVIVVSRDVSARKQAELALREAKEAAETANRAKSTFLANMSHELRTPLNAVIGLSQALQEEIYGPLTDRQRRAANTIETSGRHLLALITDILDISKIEAGRLDLNYEGIDILEVCRTSLQIVEEAARRRQIELAFEGPVEMPVVRADSRRLQQILVNLLSNSIKFTQEGGKVSLSIRLSDHERRVQLAVRDSGIGIEPDQLSLLFEPFVQLHSGLTRPYEGSGLGLALVKSLVEMHGGRVDVESTPGHGSCFTISLPLNGHPAKMPSRQAHANNSDTRNQLGGP
ncbi:MAG: PAS domain-containing protein [Caldilineaceae bacterium]|nr:PAS domain-containing protein [Caldilineaceae bacterium]